MPTITNSDLDRMQTMGRLVAAKDNQQAFESAAEYLAISRLEGNNFTRLWFFFEEGARNNCDGQYHLDAIKARLRERAEELYNDAIKEQ
jgi:hypothetical protein